MLFSLSRIILYFVVLFDVFDWCPVSKRFDDVMAHGPQTVHSILRRHIKQLTTNTRCILKTQTGRII